MEDGCMVVVPGFPRQQRRYAAGQYVLNQSQNRVEVVLNQPSMGFGLPQTLHIVLNKTLTKLHRILIGLYVLVYGHMVEFQLVLNQPLVFVLNQTLDSVLKPALRCLHMLVDEHVVGFDLVLKQPLACVLNLPLVQHQPCLWLYALLYEHMAGLELLLNKALDFVLSQPLLRFLMLKHPLIRLQLLLNQVLAGTNAFQEI